MIYTKNYDKKEVKIGFDCTKEVKLPKGWDENDALKLLDTEEYPIDYKEYKKIK